MGRSRSKSKSPKRHKSKHRKKSKSRERDRSERRSISISSHSKYRDRSRERSSKSRYCHEENPFHIFNLKQLDTFRKRSISISSRSSSDDSLDLPKRRKKIGRRKLDEVERLAEMERQRRQKEAEQKVCISGTRIV